MSIETRIADALERRHSQRDFVQRLGEAWGAIAEDVDDVRRALADTDAALRAMSQATPIRQRVGDTLSSGMSALSHGCPRCTHQS